MKTYGDISPQDLSVLRELEFLEDWIHRHGAGITPVMKARGMVCMAHDYYFIEMEEEGDRMIQAAERFYPGYLKSAIHEHAKKDQSFAIVVEELKTTMGMNLMVSLGFNGKQI